MKTIQLTQGQVAIVDDDDFEEISRFKWFAWWNRCTRSYVARRNSSTVSGKRSAILMHRVIANAGATEYVDHWNHNTLDNRRENLRVVSCRLNCANKRKLKTKTSRFKGVCQRKTVWRSTIRDGEVGPDGRRARRRVGSFRTEIEAALAYDAAARSAFGEFACLNFPLPGEQGAIRNGPQSF